MRAVAVAVHVELALLVDATLLHLEEVGEVGADERARSSRTRLPRRSSRSRCLRACRDRCSGAGTARDASRPARATGARAARTRALNGSVVVAASGSGGVPLSVQPQLGHEPRVAEEQTLRMVGIDLARPARDAERRALDEGDDAVGARDGSRSRSSSTAAASAITLAAFHVPHSAPALASDDDAHRGDRTVWFPVPPTGYGGIELVVSLLADGLVDAGHDVTLFASRRLAHQGQARLADVAEPPDPRELGNPWYDGFHALASYLQVERLRRRARSRRYRRPDLRRAAARQASGRAHAARTVDRAEPAALLAARAARAPRRDQRRATRGQPRRARTRAPSTTASTCRRTRTAPTKDDVARLHRARQPRQGTEGGDHDRAPRRASRCT